MLCAFFVLGKCQLCSLFYPVRQLHHVCRVYAEEDIQDFLLLLAVVSVVGSGLTGVSSHFLCFNSEQPLMHLQAMYQPCTLIEGIEGQFLDE